MGDLRTCLLQYLLFRWIKEQTLWKREMLAGTEMTDDLANYLLRFKVRSFFSYSEMSRADVFG